MQPSIDKNIGDGVGATLFLLRCQIGIVPPRDLLICHGSILRKQVRRFSREGGSLSIGMPLRQQHQERTANGQWNG